MSNPRTKADEDSTSLRKDGSLPVDVAEDEARFLLLVPRSYPNSAAREGNITLRFLEELRGWRIEEA